MTSPRVVMATNVTSIVPTPGDEGRRRPTWRTPASAVIATPWDVSRRGCPCCCAVAPGPSERLLTELNDTIPRHGTRIITAVELLFGTYLLAKASASECERLARSTGNPGHSPVSGSDAASAAAS
jgi:hypothetical protein